MIGIFKGTKLRIFNTGCDKAGEMEYYEAKEMIKANAYDYVLVDSDTRCPSLIMMVEPMRYRTILLGECREVPHGDESFVVVYHISFHAAKQLWRSKNEMTFATKSGWMADYQPWIAKDSDEVHSEKVARLAEFIPERRVLFVGTLDKGPIRMGQLAFVQENATVVPIRIDLSKTTLIDEMIANRCCMFLSTDGSGGISSFRTYEGCVAGVPALRLTEERYWRMLADPFSVSYVAYMDDPESLDKAFYDLAADYASATLMGKLLAAKKVATYIYHNRDYMRYVESVVCDHDKFLGIMRLEQRFDAGKFAPFDKVHDPFIFQELR